MKTKVIIHGGFADRPNSQNDGFFQEILKSTPKNVKVLLILFAKKEEEYERVGESVKLQFAKNNGGKKLEYTIASHKNFEYSIKNNDVIYLRGGDTTMLLEALKKHPDFINLVRGKIVAGESAGTYVLSGCFYSKTVGKVFSGLGLIPIKTICHFIGNNEDRLNKCPKDLKKVLLKDFQYKVFSV